MAFTFMKKISPEYVIENAIKDMRTSGLEGLKPYLTEKRGEQGGDDPVSLQRDRSSDRNE